MSAGGSEERGWGPRNTLSIDSHAVNCWWLLLVVHPSHSLGLIIMQRIEMEPLDFRVQSKFIRCTMQGNSTCSLLTRFTPSSAQSQGHSLMDCLELTSFCWFSRGEKPRVEYFGIICSMLFDYHFDVLLFFLLVSIVYILMLIKEIPIFEGQCPLCFFWLCIAEHVSSNSFLQWKQ